MTADEAWAEIAPGKPMTLVMGHLTTEQYPPTKVRDVEEVGFVDGGPVDYLARFALDSYDDHTFFYYSASARPNNPEIGERMRHITRGWDSLPPGRGNASYSGFPHGNEYRGLLV